ncbi:MAG: HEAT repeat domain-containing protein [Candidatus Aenigmatarchaeota archaeon]
MPRQKYLDKLAKEMEKDDFLSDRNKAVDFMGDFIRKSFSDDYYLTWRNECYQKLGEIGGETASEILRDAIYSEPSYNGKFIALRGYVMINQENSIPLLHETITFPDSYVRYETYKFLVQFDDTSAIPLLERELEEFSEFGNKCPTDILHIRLRIANALFKLTGEEVYEVIEKEGEEIERQMREHYAQKDDAECTPYRKFDVRVKELIRSLAQK